MASHSSFRKFRASYGKQCAAFNCYNYQSVQRHVTYHCFPKDKERCAIWVTRIRRKDLEEKIPSQLKYMVVCGEHFEASQHMNPKDKKSRLLPNALPTLVKCPNPPPLVGMKRSIRNHSAGPPPKRPKPSSSVNGLQMAESSKWPCSVCRKGVGRNSIFCNDCKLWVHKKCSDVRGSLVSVTDFRCRRCRGDARPLDGRPMESLVVGGRPSARCDIENPDWSPTVKLRSNKKGRLSRKTCIPLKKKTCADVSQYPISNKEVKAEHAYCRSRVSSFEGQQTVWSDATNCSQQPSFSEEDPLFVDHQNTVASNESSNMFECAKCCRFYMWKSTLKGVMYHSQVVSFNCHECGEQVHRKINRPVAGPVNLLIKKQDNCNRINYIGRWVDVENRIKQKSQADELTEEENIIIKDDIKLGEWVNVENEIKQENQIDEMMEEENIFNDIRIGEWVEVESEIKQENQAVDMTEEDYIYVKEEDIEQEFAFE